MFFSLSSGVYTSAKIQNNVWFKIKVCPCTCWKLIQRLSINGQRVWLGLSVKVEWRGIVKWKEEIILYYQVNWKIVYFIVDFVRSRIYLKTLRKEKKTTFINVLTVGNLIEEYMKVKQKENIIYRFEKEIGKIIYLSQNLTWAISLIFNVWQKNISNCKRLSPIAKGLPLVNRREFWSWLQVKIILFNKKYLSQFDSLLLYIK